MMKKENIPSSMNQETVQSIFVSFLIAAAYGVAAFFGFASGREMLEYLFSMLTAGWIVNVANVGGYSNLGTILSVLVMGLAWLGTFMYVWYKVGKATGLRAQLRVGAIWIAGSLAFFAITCVVVYMITGGWPLLNGA